MGNGITEGEGQFKATPAWDDWGGAIWVKDDGYQRFWSTDPGFEEVGTGWSHNGSVSTYWAETGSYGLALDNNDWAHTTHVYDPWYGDGSTLAYGMSEYPTVHLHARIRTATPGQSGKVKLREMHASISYEAEEPKRWSNPTQAPWSSLVTVAACSPTASYRTCDGYKVEYANDYWSGIHYLRAVKVRLRINNKYSMRVLVDEVGLYGGM